MGILSLSNTLCFAKDLLFKACYQMGRPINDPCFYELFTQTLSDEKFHTPIGLLKKAVLSLQNNACLKILRGDYSYKPFAGSVTNCLLKEAYALAAQAEPLLVRMTTPRNLMITAATIGVGCAIALAENHNAINLISNQLLSLTSSFQDHAFSKIGEDFNTQSEMPTMKSQTDLPVFKP